MEQLDEIYHDDYDDDYGQRGGGGKNQAIGNNFDKISQEGGDLKRNDKGQSKVSGLKNRDMSRLACLIRKKYTKLMKESIRMKKSKEKIIFCSSCRKLTSKVLVKLTGTIFQAFVSMIAVLLYVIGTYIESDPDAQTETEKTYSKILESLELIIAIIITLEYIYNLIISKKRWKFVFNVLNILDLVTILPIFIQFITDSKQNLGFARIFRVIRIMRVFRVYKIVQTPRNKESSDEGKNEITRRLIGSLLTVLAMVFLSTGIVHYLNDSFPEYFRIVIPSMESLSCSSGKGFSRNDLFADRESFKTQINCPPGDFIVRNRGKLTFDLAFYYMVITMATVGYGDIYPDTSWMRLVIGIFVIVSIITISKQTSELNDLVKLNQEYKVPYKEENDNHVVLSGFFSKASLVKFLNEFYHNDHKEKTANIKIVIIQSNYPDKEIQSVLMNPKFEENLHYIIGDIFSEYTLKKAKVNSPSSSAVFLLSDQNHIEAAKNDQYLILACKAISQFSETQIYSQFNFSQSLLHDWADWDIACASQQIKMSVIVKNGFISGFATMIMNLISSSNSFYNSEIKDTPWILEYIHGASQEIYIVKIPAEFERTKYAEFVSKSYRIHGSLVIGVKRLVKYKQDDDICYHQYLINPIDYTITNKDELIMISTDYDAAKAIFDVRIRSDPLGVSSKKIFDDEENTAQEFNFIRKNFKDENVHLINTEPEENDKVDHGNEVLRLKKVRAERPIVDLFVKRQHFKIWETSYEELKKHFKDHFIVFCKEEHLWEFMHAFDNYYKDIIFFVSDQHPSSKWDIIKRYFSNLIYIECSYSDHDDLQKLMLEQAKHVFILTWAVENSNVSDSGILPLVKIIEENFEKCKYTLELSDELNVRYLNNKGFDGSEENSKDSRKRKIAYEKVPFRVWPKYAKSDIFFSSSLESLLAISYHNEGLLDVLSKLLGIGQNDTERYSEINIIQEDLIDDKDDPKAEGLVQIEENSEITMFRYVGEAKLSYEKVFKFFISLPEPIIPIAVYRYYHSSDNDQESDLKHKSDYIITNPKKELLLNNHDKVICIGKLQTIRLEKYVAEMNNSDDENDEDAYSSNANSSNAQEMKRNNEDGAEELAKLTEEELLEKLKIEMRNLKDLARNNTSTSDNKLKFSSHKRRVHSNNPGTQLEKIHAIDEDDEEDGNSSLDISESKANNSESELEKSNNHKSQDDPDEKFLKLSENKERSSSVNKTDRKTTNLADKKKKKQIINNNYNINISASSQYQGNNTINIGSSKFQFLSVSNNGGFEITKD